MVTLGATRRLVADRRAVINVADLPQRVKARGEGTPPTPSARVRRPALASEPLTAVTPAAVASPAAAASFLAVLGGSGPPDTDGAVGPNDLLVALNPTITIQTRDGTLEREINPSDFWASLGQVGPYDPHVEFDVAAGRFILVEAANAESSAAALLIGVSDTSDPSGAWHLYRVAIDPTGATWLDFPAFGYSSDRIVVVGIVDRMDGTRVGNATWVFDKADIYAGGSGHYGRISQADSDPCTTLDPANRRFFGVANYGGAIGLTELVGTVDVPTYKALPILDGTSRWDGYPGVNFLPQEGSTTGIDISGNRSSCVVRNGSVWGAIPGFLPSRGVASRSVIAWFQASPDKSRMEQFGLLDDGPRARSYYYPSLAVDEQSDMLIGFGIFSADAYASGGYAYRSSTDPGGALRPVVTLKAGEAAYVDTGDSRNRWGDYSMTMTDPADPLSLWTIQEYAVSPGSDGASRWGTWWGRVPVEAVNRPSNDAFAGALALQGSSGAITGTNRGASRDMGEPSGARLSGRASIWYRWVAAADGPILFSTAGSTFDTLLSIFEGISIDGLKLVASNDDASARSGSSAVGIRATKGHTYWIAVDGRSGARGSLRLVWSFGTSPTTVAAPSVQLQGGQEVAGRVVVGISWLAASGTLAHYELARSTNGGPYVAVALPSPRSRSLTVALRPGANYTFRLRAVDPSGFASLWQYSRQFGVRLYEETSSSIRYSGAWTITKDSTASGGALRSTTAAGAMASFSYTGWVFAWIALIGPLNGSAKVSTVSGGGGTIDLLWPGNIPRWIAFSEFDAQVQRNTVTITCVGTGPHPRITLDAIAVLT